MLVVALPTESKEQLFTQASVDLDDTDINSLPIDSEEDDVNEQFHRLQAKYEQELQVQQHASQATGNSAVWCIQVIAPALRALATLAEENLRFLNDALSSDKHDSTVS